MNTIKKIFGILAVLIISLTVCIRFGKNTAVVNANSSITNENFSVIIDAGHGGYDPGAVGIDNITEKNINLDIAKRLQALFKVSGVKVIMTRDCDQGLEDSSAKSAREMKVSDMENRLAILKNNPDAIFISIHQNKFPMAQIKGAQVFYNKKSPDSEVLAGKIQQKLIEYVDNNNTRKHKSSGDEYYLLEYSQNRGVIVECGFISNEAEMKNLCSDKYREELALAIFSGVCEYASENKD